MEQPKYLTKEEREHLLKLIENKQVTEEEEKRILEVLEAEKKEQAFSDYEIFAPEYIKIVDKDAKEVPFVHNIIQKQINAKVKELKAAGKPVFIIILKARQHGASTNEQGRMLYNCATKSNRFGLIVAHIDDTTTEIFNKAKYMYDHLPPHVKPLQRASNAKELVFDKPTGYKGKGKGLNSKIIVQVAGKVSIGQGFTPHYLHLCLHKDSLVLLADGSSKRIEDIYAGDKVITSSGAIAFVKNKFYSGKKDTYKIKTWLSNESIAATENHKILTNNGYKECKDLTENDWICLPDIKLTDEIKEYKYRPYHGIVLLSKVTHKYFARTYKGVMVEQSKDMDTEDEAIQYLARRLEFFNAQEKPINLDYNFGYFLGYYLAEGHVTKDLRRLAFGCHVNESYIDNIIKNQDIKKTRIIIKNNRKVIWIDSRYWANLACEICGRVEDKHIPEWFFKTNEGFTKGVLSGYFSGDGSKTHEKANDKYPIHTISATSIHEKITRQIKRLILAFNIGVPSIRYDTNRFRYGKQTKNIYNIACNGSVGDFVEKLIGNEHTCNTKPNINKYKKINNNWYVKVKNIELFENADVYDIEIDHPDHNFETPIGIVSNSEFSRWPAPEGQEPLKQLSGILQAVPVSPDIEVVIESTAWGYNDFKTLWDAAVAEENEWTPLFFAWQDNPEYVMACTDEEYQREITSIKKEAYQYLFGMEKNGKKRPGIVDTFKLSKEQVRWWIWYFKNKCNNNLDEMKQYNPSTPEDAFISSGTPVFNGDMVKLRLDTLRRKYKSQPPKRGRFTFKWGNADSLDCIKDKSIKWVEDDNGPITIYEFPMGGYPYVQGGDTKGEGRDFYSGAVINNVTGNRAATIRNCWNNSKPYTWQMYCLGMYYNLALIGIEVNFNTGPIEELERLHYPRQYTRRRYDDFTKEYKHSHGWKTDGNTRPLIIDKEIHLIDDNIDLFNDITMLEECLTFIYDKNGRPDAMSGKHDDALFADMIANEIRQQQSFEAERDPEIVRRSFDEDTERDYNRDDENGPYN